MTRAIFGFPNFADTDYYTVDVFGGSWTTGLPLTNLQDRFMTKVARSADALAASTQFEAYLGTTRDIRLIGIPDCNASSDGQYRFRGTNTPAWSSVTLNAAASLGASSVVFLAGSAGATVTTDHRFRIAGQNQVYRSTTNAVIAASGTASISITPNLIAGASGAAIVTCCSGDYTTPVIDTGTLDIWNQIYEYGTLYFGHPSFWTLKATAEDARFYPLPMIYDTETVSLCKFLKVEITDTSNADGYIELPRFFVCGGFQPSINIAPQNRIHWENDTQVSTSKGGARWYDAVDARRVFTCTINNLPENEALAWVLDMQKRLGKDGQLLFVYDSSDTINIQRMSMVCTMREIQPLEHTEIDRRIAAFVLEEVIQ